MHALEERWNIEDEGEVSDLLNVEIFRDSHGVHLRQTSYIDRLLATFASEGIPADFRSDNPPAGPELPDLRSRGARGALEAGTRAGWLRPRPW